jgi:hypothetical protein
MARAVKWEAILGTAGYVKGAREIQRQNQAITQHTNKAGSSLKAAFGTFTAGAAVLEMRKWVAAARDSNRVTAQVNAVIASTHGAAGLSAKGFADLAKSIEKTAAVDDDIIAGGEAILATFTAIKAGGPDKVFERAEQAAVDMAAALNHGQVSAEGLQQANLLLGKALQDPVAGLTKLMRAGVSFSAQQKTQIADLVKHGQVAKAQGVILTEVNKEFGGSAAAAVTPAKRLAAEWGDMQEVLGNLLIPAIDRGAQVLSGILGIIDRNRKAFGALFAVLASGTAIIGGLILVEKTVTAVTEAWGVATAATNKILGVTKVQAVATAEAETALAASTTAAGTAAGGASVGFGALAGRLGLFGAAAAAGAYRGSIFDDQLKRIHESSNPLVQALDKLIQATTIHIGKNKEATKTVGELTAGTIAQTAAMVKQVPVMQTGADQAKLNADAIKDLSGKLADLQGQFASTRDSMAQTIISYDGLISKSKVTAGEVVKDLHNQVANFRTYAKDTQALIRAGVNPAAIQELSQKGPQFVHALATGSNKELQQYKRDWAARQAEVSGSFTKSLQAQLVDLQAKIKQMQRQINSLRGKTVTVTARTNVEVAQSVRQYLAASHVPGFHAQGALIPGYGGGDIYPAMLEPGEAVIPKDKVKQPAFQAWAKAEGIPGFQAGGLVGRFYNPTVRQTTRIGQSMADVAAAVLSMAGAIPPGASADVAKVAQWTATILHEAQSAAAWARRIMFESGGNWSAVNRVDSNWLAGHPSVGGAQVIRRTFAAYAGPYRNVGPFLYGVSIHPYANSYAGGNYAQHQYGSLAAVDPRVRPIGYAKGGLVMDQGGWLQPGWNPPTYNGTGRLEPVGIDYDRLAAAVARALTDSRAGLGVRAALEGMTLVVDDRRQGRLEARQAGLYSRGG